MTKVVIVDLTVSIIMAIILVSSESCHHLIIMSRIDRIARLMFPLSFTAFNILYWLSYSQVKILSQSKSKSKSESKVQVNSPIPKSKVQVKSPSHKSKV